MSRRSGLSFLRLLFMNYQHRVFVLAPSASDDDFILIFVRSSRHVFTLTDKNARYCRVNFVIYVYESL